MMNTGTGIVPVQMMRLRDILNRLSDKTFEPFGARLLAIVPHNQRNRLGRGGIRKLVLASAIAVLVSSAAVHAQGKRIGLVREG